MVDMINTWAGQWAPYFGIAVLQNTAFLAVILLTLHFKPRLSASVKYLVCLVGLIKILTPPFIPAALHLTGRAPEVSLIGLTSGMPVVGLLSAGQVTVPRGSTLSLAGTAFIAWIALAFFYLVLTLVSTLSLRRTLATAVRVASSQTALPGGIEILRSSRVTVPLTLGLFSKRIYVPAAWDEWTEECRKLVIAHEMAHIRRRDGAVQVLQALVRAAYLFHPLVWIIDRRINQYREMACDDAASRTQEGGCRLYSEYLLRIAEGACGYPSVCASASALLKERNHLLSRVKYQIEEGNMQKMSVRKKALVVAGLLLLFLPMSWYCSNAEHRPEASGVSEAMSRQLPEGMKLVRVDVMGRELVRVDGREMAMSHLRKQLREQVGDKWDGVVILLGCGDGVTMKDVDPVRELLVDMDLRKVIFTWEGDEDLTLILPGKGDQERLQEIPSENIAVLSVDPFGNAYLDDEPVEFSEITEAVRARLAENDKLIVSLQTLGVSPYDDFATLLARVKAAGATRISIGIPTKIGD